MTRDNTDGLSRRKLLGSVATIGGAAALGGAGSVAFLSDEEQFANNRLVAGELDLKVDWEEHYSDWSDDEAEGVGEVAMTDGDPANVPEGYVGLPDPMEPLLAVPSEDLETFMDNTAIEAYPDTNDDGVQDLPSDWDICEQDADTPSVLSSDLRTDATIGDGPNPQTTAPGDPLVDIEDVKPGDFGELTLSYHLCGNPGYVYLQAANVESAENGYTEPERKDPDESGDADGDGEDDRVELLDEIQTTWWYDEDGDNVIDTDGGGGTGGEADVVIVADGSGSVTTDSSKFQALQDGAEALVNAVGSNVNVGLVVFSNSASVNADLTDSKQQTIQEIQNDSNYPGGGTDVGAGIDAGQAHLTGPAGRPNADKILVVLTNGISSTGRSEATDAKNAGTTIYGIAYGDGADEDLIEDISSPPKVDDGTITEADEFAFDADEADIETVFSDIGSVITGDGETVFFRGTLREALGLLTSGDGILLDADPSTAGADAFENSTTNYIGFAWYLPVNHANEIQTDSASFDLRFYTEQARHNSVGDAGNT